MIPLSDLGVLEVLREYYGTLRPRDLLPVDRWADTKRILAGTASAQSGLWRTDRNPPQREIMQVLSHDHPAKDVVVVTPTQWGKTEILLNFMFQAIDQRSGSILCGQPTIGDARKFIRQRFDPSIRFMRELKAKIGNQDGKKGGDSDMLKVFPNGLLIMAWSNSAANLSAMPCAWFLADEIDRWAFDADGQGCPVEMGIARTENFPNAKRLFVSTPANKIDSRIWPRFEAGDQRLFLVPCWHCNHFFFMDWPDMEWEKDRNGLVIPESVRVKCPKCEYLNEEKHKQKALHDGHWNPTNPAGAYPSFRINALYKPRAWGSWLELVNGYRKAKKNVHTYKVWYNTKRALPWEEEGTKAEPHKLMARREVYEADVPGQALILTAGVDVQDDRLEAEVVGWGAGFENWGIERVTLWGDTSGSAVWNDLDHWLQGSWERPDGSRQYIAASCLDAFGHRTEEVYRWCKPREPRRIFPAYGRGGDGLPILGRVTRRHKSGVYLFPIGTDTCKDEILAGLLVEEIGEKYCHFPMIAEYDEEFFKQLTAEAKVLIFQDNRETFKWRKLRARNEALDIRQLNRAALEITSVDLDTMTEPYLAQPADFTPRKSKKRRSKGIQL
jgi:phage terminase large subunit GpA-like protein